MRRDTEEAYTEYRKHLADAAGLEATDEAALRRMDRRRRKKGSNAEWVNPYDPEVLSALESEVRSYGAEPDRGPRKWAGKRAEQAVVYANRQRIGRQRGKRLLRRRGELVERTFAHAYATGALRRLYCAENRTWRSDCCYKQPGAIWHSC